MIEKQKSKRKDKLKNKKKLRDRDYFLSTDTGVKHRSFYMDNSDYVNGVYDGNSQVLRPLTEEEKDFLSKFNAEYYCAKYNSKDDSSNLHKNKASKAKIDRIRRSIKYQKKKLKKFKSDYDKSKLIYEKIAKLTEKLIELYPKKELTDANNTRNADIMNKYVDMKAIAYNAPDLDYAKYDDALHGILDSVDEDEE